MPHSVSVLIFFKSFLDNKISIFEEYGTFNAFNDAAVICVFRVGL